MTRSKKFEAAAFFFLTAVLLFGRRIPVLAAEDSAEAFAVYSEQEQSLTFYCGEVPEAGTEYDGKSVTEVYTEFTDLDYTCEHDVPWSASCQKTVTSVSTDASFADARPQSCAYWFFNFGNCLDMDLGYLDTSEVTSMREMFSGCSSLTELDLSGFDTGRVTTLYGMFQDCFALTTVDLSSFDTSAVSSMSNLFYCCRALENLDLSGFDTGSVTAMSFMFYSCTGLGSLDLGSFDTSNVTSMISMFENCQGLGSLDLDNFDSSNVTDMRDMFENCSGLTELDLSHFDTGKVSSMVGVFQNCSALEAVDLSGWDTGNVARYNGFFNHCTSLKSVVIGDAFTLFANSPDNLFGNYADLQIWYDGDGNPVSEDYGNGISGSGTYYSEIPA